MDLNNKDEDNVLIITQIMRRKNERRNQSNDASCINSVARIDIFARGLVLCLALFALSTVMRPVHAQDAGREVNRQVMEQVHDDVRRNLEAVYSGDVDTVLGFTNEHMIKAMGGEQEARSRLKNTFERIKAAGIKIDSLEFPAVPTLYSDRDFEYVIVPTVAVISRGNERVEATNYQLGIRPVGEKNWAYFDGSRINTDNIYSLYPGFPRDIEFPEVFQNPL